MSKEALRYLENAKEILSKSGIEENRYRDIKFVREACSTAYLSVLIAIDEYLIKRGVGEKKLPKSIDGYREMLKKHLSVHNGKIIRNFEALYKELHIAGYYRGLLEDVDMVKAALKSAGSFIEKIK
ncbi:MAG: DUF5618 family protein [Nitrospinae bacterium]|nr:DUF5618 family protein [Nitrospinota bacterium]